MEEDTEEEPTRWQSEFELTAIEMSKSFAVIRAATARMAELDDFVRSTWIDSGQFDTVGPSSVRDGFAVAMKARAAITGPAVAALAAADAAAQSLRALAESIHQNDAILSLWDDNVCGVAARQAQEHAQRFVWEGPPILPAVGAIEIITPAVDFSLVDSIHRAASLQQWWPPAHVPSRWLRGEGFYKPAIPLWAAEEEDDLPPDDMVLIRVLRVSGGSLAQVGNLFEHYYGPARSPEPYFVVRERSEGRWTIYYAEDSSRDARGRAMDLNAVVGFIVGVDLPVVTVEFYGGVESDRPLISSFVKRLEQVMEVSGFKFKVANQTKREMWSDTEVKLKSLVGNRREHVVGGRVTLTKIRACQLAGIDPATVQRHMPELYARWYDSEYSGF